MNTHSARRFTALSLAVVAATGLVDRVSRADSITIMSARDNTLIEEKNGALSNGAGFGVFAGRVGSFGAGLRRRAVLWFDVAGQLPAGSTIQSVTLVLTVTQSNSGEQTFTVHRMGSDWGEGESSSPGGTGDLATKNDATWLHTFWPDQFWTTVGGDYEAASSATSVIADLGELTFASTENLVADVQSWVDAPGQEFGWMIKGDESEISTVKRFGSREWDAEKQRPTLVIQFDPGEGVLGDLNGDGEVDPADLAIVLGNWGPCVDPPAPACPADLDGDGVVGPADLSIVLSNWG